MDMISNLPDPVLSHILSLLPTKLVVSTCVLSKRWRFLWLKVHNLDLDCHARHGLPKDQSKQIVTGFINFVDSFFTQRDKKLSFKKFCLRFIAPDFSSKPVGPWILAVMSSGVEKFVLDIRANGLFHFPCSVFACKTLVALELIDRSVIIDAPSSSIHFPSLKLLCLERVHFENQHSFSNLLLGCPVLENLEMFGIQNLEDFCFVISLPTLTRLVIDHSDVMEEPIRLSLDAPSLKYLNLQLLAPQPDIYLKNLDNLVQAIICLHRASIFFLDHESSCVVKDAVGALYNVRDLELMSSTMQALGDVSFEGFPIFHNLVQLKLEGFCCNWRMLLSLVQKFPLLQHLTIRLGLCDSDGNCRVYLGSVTWAELYVSNCLPNLRTLCFGLLHDWDNDNYLCGDTMEFLTNVLKNSKALENVSVTMCGSKEKIEAFKQKLASLERASKKCEFKFKAQVFG